MRENVVLGGVHEFSELRRLRPEAVGDFSPLRVGGLFGLLGEGRPDVAGDHGLLGLADMGERVAHEVDAAALPGRAQNLGGGGLQALVGVGDNQLHPA